MNSCKIQITRFLGSALTDEDFGGAQGQAEFVRTLGVEARQGGDNFLSALLRDLAEELCTLSMFDEVTQALLLFVKIIRMSAIFHITINQHVTNLSNAPK